MGLSRLRDCHFNSCSSNLTCCFEYNSTAYQVYSSYSYSYHGYNKLCDYSYNCLSKSSPSYNYDYDERTSSGHTAYYFAWIPLVILSIIIRVCIISSRRRRFQQQQTTAVVTTTSNMPANPPQFDA